MALTYVCLKNTYRGGNYEAVCRDDQRRTGSPSQRPEGKVSRFSDKRSETGYVQR